MRLDIKPLFSYNIGVIVSKVSYKFLLTKFRRIDNGL